MSESLREAGLRGKCSNCETYFSSKSEWEVTYHMQNEFDRRFCSKKCFREFI